VLAHVGAQVAIPVVIELGGDVGVGVHGFLPSVRPGRVRLWLVPRWPVAGVVTTRAGPQETHRINVSRGARAGPAAGKGAGGAGAVRG
jgi:hypothetical protein